jgi:mobilome CxxCx(11)CxxC protein
MAQANQEEQKSALRVQCWNTALHAFGTGFIFEQRGHRYKWRLQWLTYVSLAVPVIIGLLVLGYGEFKGLKALIGIGIAVGIVQVMISLWSIVGGWVDRSSYAIAAAPANYTLSDEYANLAANPPMEYREFLQEYEKLELKDKLLQQQDYQQDIKESEKRMGMHAALRKFRRACAGCGQVPDTMSSTVCGVCGNFKYRVD